MTEPQYVDLLIVDDDLVLDAGRVPAPVTDRACIAQDIGHMIRDSGLLVAMVAERSSLKQRDFRQQIELLVETDTRLVPGTARMTALGNGNHLITATTVAFGPVSQEVSQ